MSAPPPPPPRRARGPVDPTPSAPSGPGGSSPAPPPPRRPRPEGAPPNPSTTTLGATTTTTSGPTRAQRRAATAPPGSRSSRNGGGRRRGFVIGGVIVVLLALLVGGAFAAGVFSSSGGGKEPLQASDNVKLVPGALKVRWPGLGPGASDPELPNRVMKAIGDYVDEGIVPGLRTGVVKTEALAGSFDQAAIAQLNDAGARGALLDETLPKAIGELTITSRPIDMVALNDNDNNLVFVSAKVHLDILVQSKKGWYTVVHKGELVLAPEADGSLRVTAWDAKALRTPPGPKPKPEKKSSTSSTTKAGGSSSNTTEVTTATTAAAP